MNAHPEFGAKVEYLSGRTFERVRYYNILALHINYSHVHKMYEKGGGVKHWLFTYLELELQIQRGPENQSSTVQNTGSNVITLFGGFLLMKFGNQSTVPTVSFDWRVVSLMFNYKN